MFSVNFDSYFIKNPARFCNIILTLIFPLLQSKPAISSFFSLDVFSFLDVVITTANYFNSENNCVKKDIMQFFLSLGTATCQNWGGLQKWQTLNYLQDGIVKGKKNTPILIQVIQSRTWHWETFSLLFPYFDDEIPFESKGVWSYKYTYWFKNMENGIFKLNYMKLPYF